MKQEERSEMLYELEDVAERYGADIIQITRGRNGYPSGLHYGLIGFSDFEDAKQAAEEINGETRSLRKRDGWQFYEDMGWAYKPFDLLREAQEDDSDGHVWLKYDKGECLEECRERLEYYEHEEGRYVDYCSLMELSKVFDDMTDNEFIFVGSWLRLNGTIPYEVRPKTTTGFSEDVWRYEIGVVAD